MTTDPALCSIIAIIFDNSTALRLTTVRTVRLLMFMALRSESAWLPVARQCTTTCGTQPHVSIGYLPAYYRQSMHFAH
ncbi:hypothetical protein C8R42DRAFT_419572 [Lentinula raphanica]|nr:hypothetical protein C8R42DRAFT_419572 [Lentinula raphanica]